MEVFRQYRSFFYMIMSWAVVGAVAGPAALLYIPLCLFVLKSKGQYMELMIGFFFILILSDNRSHYFEFAYNAKEIYISFLALFLFMDRKKFTPFDRLSAAFVPFFIVAFICLTYAPVDNFLNSLEKTVSYILLLIVVPNYVKRAYVDKHADFFRVIIFFGVFILLLSLVLNYILPDITHLEGRYRGVFGNPNGLGVFCLLFLLLFSLIIELNPELFQRREKTLIYALILLSIILCGSRSTLFAILIYFFLSYSYKISPIVGFFVFVLIAGSYGYVSTNIISIATSLGLEKYLRVETLTEASGRFVAWNFAWINIKQNLYIGRGFDYTNYIFQLYSQYLSNMGHQGNAHNSYITLWLDTGLLGLVTFVFAFIRTFVKATRKTRLAMPILYAVIFSTFFESWLTASLNPFTIIVFIILSILTSDVIIRAQAKIAIPVQ
jgi:O-antigen ligase